MFEASAWHPHPLDAVVGSGVGVTAQRQQKSV